MVDFADLVGKTLVSVWYEYDEIIFTDDQGVRYKQYHAQSCCESVTIDDICGDLDDLLHTPILVAEERCSGDNINPFGSEEELGIAALSKVSLGDEDYWHDDDKSETWTFYYIRTHKGDVTIRWYGTSNGYYSESVCFEILASEEE